MESQTGSAPLFRYPADSTFLLVGEGNFSFARALMRSNSGLATNLICTSFDSEADAVSKYVDDSMADTLSDLRAAGATVLFDADATQLKKRLAKAASAIRKQSGNAGMLHMPWHFVDYIVFNFPHVGFGIKDQDRNVAANQAMLHGFFTIAAEMLSDQVKRQRVAGSMGHGGGPEVHVTIKMGKPYDLWRVPFLARSCGLELKTSWLFNADHFPGYEHRRTLGFKAGLSVGGNEEIRAGARTYSFVLPREAVKNEQ